MNRFDDMTAAVAEANQTLRAADSMSGNMARLLCGRLRHVSPNTLQKLKRELNEFNAKTGEWKT